MRGAYALILVLGLLGALPAASQTRALRDAPQTRSLQDAPQTRSLRDVAVPVKRIALLIGNAAYRQDSGQAALRPFKPLRNPCNDIERIAAALISSGWPETSIISICDATRSQIRDAVDRFKDEYLTQEHAFGFVFYAGHGLHLGNDAYLFGVDSFVNLENDARTFLRHSAGSVLRGGVRLYADIISQVGDAGSGSIFIVVDACRETPVDQIVRKDGALAPDYVNVQRSYPKPALGVRLFYSTAYGDRASDGVAQGSPFALAFAEHLTQQGRVETLISQVIRTVRDRTRNSPTPQIPDAIGALNPPPPDSCLTVCGDR